MTSRTVHMSNIKNLYQAVRRRRSRCFLPICVELHFWCFYCGNHMCNYVVLGIAIAELRKCVFLSFKFSL